MQNSRVSSSCFNLSTLCTLFIKSFDYMQEPPVTKSHFVFLKIRRVLFIKTCVCMQEPPVTNSYFVFFKTQKAAAAAAQCSIFPEGAQDAFKVVGAPGPEEV